MVCFHLRCRLRCRGLAARCVRSSFQPGLACQKARCKSARAATLCSNARCARRRSWYVEQVAILSQITAVISTQLDAPDEGAAYLCMCFELGWLLESQQRWSGRHPANLVALAMAGILVQCQRGALLMDVVLEFCKWKQMVLRALQSRFGETVCVAEFFQIHKFETVHSEEEQRSEEQRSKLAIAMQAQTWKHISVFVCESLNVTRLPVQRNGRWCVAVLPNVVGASDIDVASGVGTFYEVLELHRQQEQRGDALSSGDVAKLAVALRGGAGVERTFINYLAAKWALRSCRKHLGLINLGKYDEDVRGLCTECAAAFLKVHQQDSLKSINRIV